MGEGERGGPRPRQGAVGAQEHRLQQDLSREGEAEVRFGGGGHRQKSCFGSGFCLCTLPLTKNFAGSKNLT